MGTTSKKELTNVVADKLKLRQMLVREVVQTFLDACIDELARGKRLEFRDFGVFECVSRAARKARNPKTGEIVEVPPKTVVDFKMGKEMRAIINAGAPDEGNAGQPAAPGC
ncbi:MAG: integration host factor subunit beta [Planctomycetes bacterium]|nr:integration host factor subunit beta [Planctomycetota bacterium]